MDKGDWWAIVHGGHKESDMTEQHFHFTFRHRFLLVPRRVGFRIIPGNYSDQPFINCCENQGIPHPLLTTKSCH